MPPTTTPFRHRAGAYADLLVVLSVVMVTLWQLHPSLLLSSSLVTGGDTGAHVALASYLAHTHSFLNPTPWYPGWFDGMPTYSFYFVLPDYLAALGSYVIGFAVAMKLATILGSVLMPVAAYLLGRLFRAPRPIPAALAAATLPFLFNASYTIDGGNLFSTLAGEYAFSLSLALSLVALGLFARGSLTGRGYVIAGVVLSLTLAAHVLPWFYALAGILVVVVLDTLRRPAPGRSRWMPLRFATFAGIISFGLSAWWLLPFGLTQSMTNSMGYVNDNVSSLHAVFTQLGWYNATGGPAGPRWIIVLSGLGLLVAFAVRDRLGMVLATLTIFSLASYVFAPQSVIWNERLIPMWYISIYLLGGWFVGHLVRNWAVAPLRKKITPPSSVAPSPVAPTLAAPALQVNEEALTDTLTSEARRIAPPVAYVIDDLEDPSSVSPSDSPIPRATSRPRPVYEDRDEPSQRRRLLVATLLVGLLGLLSTVPGLLPASASALGLDNGGNQVSAWAQWNYQGYQNSGSWPEYHNLMTTVGAVAKRYGCGRAMWEYNSSENRFGTTMALMLLPYWTNYCVDSMEGLLFESSATTPYHFLDQAELSSNPSDPQVGLNYGPLDIQEGISHLQMLGVKYYIAYTPDAVTAANHDSQLTLVASTRTWPASGTHWRIYLVHNAPIVAPLPALPNVISGITSRLSWLSANENWWLTPGDWSLPMVSSGLASWPHGTLATPLKYYAAPQTTVSDVQMGDQSISFHVTKLDTPVMVKISYFPRWHASGALGPFRASPNLMIVVPTSHNVTLTYGEAPSNIAGNDITVATLSGIAIYFVARRLRSRRRAQRGPHEEPSAPLDVNPHASSSLDGEAMTSSEDLEGPDPRELS